jgi:hypothetical protein
MRVKKTAPAKAPAADKESQEAAQAAGNDAPEPKHKAEAEPRRELTAQERYIAESRKCLNEPLAPGQQYFESPEGIVKIGDADKAHIWCAQANHGKGMWINPRR